MNFDDVVYLSLLFFSIGFGYYYRTIRDKDVKRNVGTLVGLLLTLIVSGIHIVHSFVTVFVNTLIILYIPKKYVPFINVGQILKHQLLDNATW
jgi:lysophospholipid acyltransferase 7